MKINNTNYQKLHDKILDSKELIQDLAKGAGYSYSRIAYRIGVSPSAIQKLATKPNRQARYIIYHKLFALYEKVFYGCYASPQALAYLQQKLDQYKKSG